MQRLLAGIAMALVYSVSITPAPLSAQEIQPTITVVGTGEVSVEPDMATVVVGVQADAEDAADALDQASAATQRILAQLEAQAIASEYIRSGAIRLQPRYSQSALSNGQRIVGYRAVNSVEVQVNDLAALGGLLAAVVGDGANRLDGVRFGLQDPQSATDAARRVAVAEAIRRAHLYADAAGVSVGPVLSMSEQGGVGYRALNGEPRMMAEMAMSSPMHDVPIAPGKIELNATLTMVFAIATP